MHVHEKTNILLNNFFILCVTECEEYAELTKDLNVQCDDVDSESSGKILLNEFPHVVSICVRNIFYPSD